MRTVRKILCVSAVLTAALALFCYLALQQEPAFYRSALGASPQQQAALGEQLRSRIHDLLVDSRCEGSWELLVNEEQINGWLAAFGPRPSSFSDPRVALNLESAQVACRYEGKVSTVVSLAFEARLTDEPNEIALRVRTAWAGALPVPHAVWQSRASKAAAKAGLSLRWCEQDGDPIAIVTFPMPAAPGLVRQLSNVELRDGAVWFSGHTIHEDDVQRKSKDGLAKLSAAEKEGFDFFEHKIRPVLVKHCYDCHSAAADEVGGGLRLDSREGLRGGGETGPAVVPHEVERSLVIKALRYESLEMPPDEQLPESTVADFVRWIEMGAPDPRGGGGRLAAREEIDFAAARQFWSFQPPRGSPPPAVKDQSWPRNHVDRFVLARMEQQGIAPVADADPRVLVRRVYFDLIGLPPTFEEVEQFVRASIRNPHSAFRKLIDRLLASPHFGERWGRHWLDVARYADSDGSAANYLFPQAWRYRDYVIDSFNDDKPYDRFLREQIAGDLLIADRGLRIAELAKDQSAIGVTVTTGHPKSEMLIATGFLAIGKKTLVALDCEKTRMDMIDEQIDVTTRAILGLTVSCARCHDHKFDPIPTKDYYALAGIFRSVKVLHGSPRRRGGGPAGLVQIGEISAAREQQFVSHHDRLRELRGQLKRLRQQLKTADRNDSRPPGTAPVADNKEQIARLVTAIHQLEQRAPAPLPLAIGVEEGDVSDAHILLRGEVDNRGDVVPRGFLTIFCDGEPPALTADQSGRLELADWLTSTKNPLTARVMVNRIWQHLFGQGLVRTVDNFGATGELPTHPKLLDDLAARFMKNGWSVKQLIREIMLSRTYQLSSAFGEPQFEDDPENRLLWRMPPRRLDAESIRDAMLAVSGQLDRSQHVPSPIARFAGDLRVVQVNDKLPVQNHRSVYLPVFRNAVSQMFQAFDFADPNMTVGLRDRTTVPTQALFLLNNPFVIEQSKHAARRLLDQPDLDDDGRIEAAYQWSLCRPPSGDERRRALQFIRRTAGSVDQVQANRESATTLAWSALFQALFACAEFRYLD